MLRVLHLVDPHAAGGGACTLRLLADVQARLAGAAHRVLILGTAADAALASRCGVSGVGSAGAPGAVPRDARRSLRRLIASWERAEGRFDLFHAWSASAAMTLLRIAPGRSAVISLTVGPEPDRAGAGLARALRRHPAPVLVASLAVREECLALGVDEHLLHLHRPAVDAQHLAGSRREALREAMGVRGDAFVVGLLMDPPQWADAWPAMLAVSRLAAAGHPMHLVVHPRAAHRADARHWVRWLEGQALTLVADALDEPWRLVPALDAALLLSSRPGPGVGRSGSDVPRVFLGRRTPLRARTGVLPILWAMAAGVPVVAEDDAAARDVIEDGVSGLLFEPDDVNGACHQLLRLAADPGVTAGVMRAGRERVRDHFSVDAYIAQLGDLYDRLAGTGPERVAVREQAEEQMESPAARKPESRSGVPALAEPPG